MLALFDVVVTITQGIVMQEKEKNSSFETNLDYVSVVVTMVPKEIGIENVMYFSNFESGIVSVVACIDLMEIDTYTYFSNY